jgi:hypothetical protein
MKIKKNISTYTHQLLKKQEQEITSLFHGYNNVRNYVFSRYSSIGSFLKIYNHKKEIRDLWTKDKTLESFGIPRRYARMALDDAISALKSMWTKTLDNARARVRENKSLSADEKHYVFYMLKSRNLLSDILNGNEIIVPDKLKDKNLNLRKMHRKICSIIRLSFPKKPKAIPLGSMMIDQEMWSMKDGMFMLSGSDRGKRIALELLSIVKLSGNLRIGYDKTCRRLKISNCIEVDSKPLARESEAPKIIGVDKNYLNVLDSDSGGNYGSGFNETQSKATDVLSQKDKRRQYYQNKVKHLKENGEHDKAQIIIKNNLGKKKYNKKKNALNEECRKKINMAIKELLCTEQPTRIVCESLKFTSNNKKYGKKVKNKLGRFQKGVVDERLKYHAALNEVAIEEVNAAYSSQTCDKCKSPHGVRKGDMFHCTNCDRVGYSGHVAASVIKERSGDNEINLSMSPQQVKTVLVRRFNESQESRLSESEGEFLSSEPSQPRPHHPHKNEGRRSELLKNISNSTHQCG